MITKLLVLLLVFAAGLSKSLAGESSYYFEPSIGISNTSIEASSSSSNSKTSVFGPDLRAKIGLIERDLYIGFDLEYSKFFLKEGASNYDSYDIYMLRAGFSFGNTLESIPWRWAFTLDLPSLSSVTKAKGSDKIETSNTSGSGFRLDFGYFVSDSGILNFVIKTADFKSSTATTKSTSFGISYAWSIPYDLPKENWRTRRMKEQGLESNPEENMDSGSELDSNKTNTDSEINLDDTDSSNTENQDEDISL